MRHLLLTLAACGLIGIVGGLVDWLTGYPVHGLTGASLVHDVLVFVSGSILGEIIRKPKVGAKREEAGF